MFSNNWWNRWQVKTWIRSEVISAIECHLEPVRMVARDRYNKIRHRLKCMEHYTHSQNARINELDERLKKLERETERGTT